MRKLLASFLAAAMVASVGATMSFAATNTSAKDSASFSDKFTADTSVAQIEVVVKPNGGTAETYKYSFSHEFKTGDTNVKIAEALSGQSLTNIEIDNKRYDVELKQDASTADLVATLTPAAGISTTTIDIYLLDADGNRIQANGKTVHYGYTFTKGTNGGSGDELADLTEVGLNVEQVIECDGQGNPIPLTEKKDGVDKDENDDDGVQSGTTLYFMIKDGGYKFDNDTYWKLRINKGDNAKYVKAVSDVSKNFSSNLFNAVNGGVVSGTSGRHRFIKVELNEIYTDDEYKISLDMRISPKSAATNVFDVNDDAELKVKDFTFYMKNIVRAADNDWSVGIGGLMLNPLENDWNEVTYFDEDGDLAFMKFFADSDVDKFYAKLSTKWEHADYASYFNDQDAFIFNFTGSPKMSSTSRVDLQIYNPFIDDDGNEMIDPSTAVVYQVIDGDLYDVTDSFKYEEGDNGDMAYTTRTRFLGTYIICEKAVEEAAETETPADLVPEEPVDQTPVETPVDNSGKTPANTGRFA